MCRLCKRTIKSCWGSSRRRIGAYQYVCLFREKGANKVVLDKAIKYIKSELESGRPVFIGVDDAPNQKINEVQQITF